MRRTSWLFQTAGAGNAAGSNYKLKVPSNVGGDVSRRFYHHFWMYRISQLTTGNIRAMKEVDIGGGGATPVLSDLQIHGLHQFRIDTSPSLVFAIPKTSRHCQNIEECTKASIMVGHTDPQIFHWFKLLGTVPPRSIASGRIEVLSGDLALEAWQETFVRHPHVHEMAMRQWETDETKTEEERMSIQMRERTEDENRMRRMSSGDWRAKHKDRERNPTKSEDDESPIYVMKQSAFMLARLVPEVQLYGDYTNAMTRVWDQEFPAMDPLARVAPRYIRTCNVSRQKLIASLNINYNLKLTNGFVFNLDKSGLWMMGTQENFRDDRGHAKEEWMEFRVEYGKDQIIDTEGELEWWFKGLMRLGVPETGTTSGAIEDASPQDMAFKQ